MREVVSVAMLVVILGMTMFAVAQGIKELSERVAQFEKIDKSLDNL